MFYLLIPQIIMNKNQVKLYFSFVKFLSEIEWTK
jgi:hypothetical protein